MKNKFFSGLVLGAALCLGFVGGFAAGTGTRQPLPAVWGTATTGFGLNSSGAPYATIAGANYTGVSTNVSFQRLGGTNTLVVKNGIITSVE